MRMITKKSYLTIDIIYILVLFLQCNLICEDNTATITKYYTRKRKYTICRFEEVYLFNIDTYLENTNKRWRADILFWYKLMSLNVCRKVICKGSRY